MLRNNPDINSETGGDVVSVSSAGAIFFVMMREAYFVQFCGA
jgi:hypothetical protein